MIFIYHRWNNFFLSLFWIIFEKLCLLYLMHAYHKQFKIVFCFWKSFEPWTQKVFLLILKNAGVVLVDLFHSVSWLNQHLRRLANNMISCRAPQSQDTPHWCCKFMETMFFLSWNVDDNMLLRMYGVQDHRQTVRRRYGVVHGVKDHRPTVPL